LSGIEAISRAAEALTLVGQHAIALESAETLPAARKIAAYATDANRAVTLIGKAGYPPAAADDLRQAVQLLRDTPLDVEQVHTAGTALRESVRKAILVKITEIAEKDMHDVSNEDMQFMKHFEAMPPEVGPQLPDIFLSYGRWADSLDTPSTDPNARRAFDTLLPWAYERHYLDNPKLKPVDLLRDVEAILAKDSLDHIDQQRLTTIKGLPEEYRFAPSAELVDALNHEVRAIAEKPDEAIAIDDLQRLKLFEQLPEEVRPHLPSTQFDFTQLANGPTLPNRPNGARDVFNVLRQDVKYYWDYVDNPDTARSQAFADVQRLAEAKQLTPDIALHLDAIDRLPNHLRPEAPSLDFKNSVFNELRTIVESPDALTLDQLQRIQLLDSLPVEFRLGIADSGSRFSDMITEDGVPNSRYYSLASIKAELQSWLRLDSKVGPELVNGDLVAGRDMDWRTLRRLNTDADFRSRVGMTETDLRWSTLNSLGRSPSTPYEGVVSTMETALGSLKDVDRTNPQIAEIVDDIESLLERNIARGHEGAYLDFADLGDVRAKAGLMKTLIELQPSTSGRDIVTF
jgi:hypothetical protein